MYDFETPPRRDGINNAIDIVSGTQIPLFWKTAHCETYVDIAYVLNVFS